MAQNHYDWEVGQPPPVLKRHSQIKHEIIKDYLSAYIDTLVRNPRQEQLKLTLVDGFAGGGEYLTGVTNEIVPGSPLILLGAADEAAVHVNLARRKPFHLDAHFYFVEKKKSNYQYLIACLGAHGYGKDVRIHPLKGDFQDYEARIIKDIQTRGRACRSIF